jgi:hypothetical protein
MSDANKQEHETRPGEHDLPEAFTMNDGKEVSHLSQPPAAGRTGGLDKVREGSEESFPASDPPAVMQQATIPKQPVDKQK